MLLRLVGLSPILAASIAAQAQEAVPARRAHHSVVYDDAGTRVLLCCGSTPIEGGNSFRLFNDLWAFDGSQWTSLGESGTKASGAQLAWDSRQNRVVSFGGYTGGMIGDLRVLDGNAWTKVGQHPEFVMAEPGFVYDSHRNRFVAFGGSAGRGSALGDTWELTGTHWSKFAGPSPAARQGHLMV